MYQDETVFQQWMRTLKEKNQGIFLLSLSSAYVAVGKAQRAVRLMELFLELNPSHGYTEIGWVARAREISGISMAGFTGLARLAMPEMVNTLLKALNEDGRVGKYHMFLDALDRDRTWIKLSAMRDTLPFSEIALHLLDHLEERAPLRGLSFGAQIVEHLRCHTTRQNLAASDRHSFGGHQC